MKSLVRRAMVICLFTTLTGTVTFAKSTKSNVTLSSDTVVNGTVVKKGMYRVVFDEPSSQLSIFKGSKLIAKTAARLEKSDRKARFTEFLTVLEGMDQRLVSVSFEGYDSKVVVAQGNMQAGTN